MKIIRWFSLNVGYASLFYFGFIEEIEGARNAALFLSWVFIICMFFTMVTAEGRQEYKKRARKNPVFLDLVFNSSVCIFLAWFAQWFTACFFV